MSARQPWRSLRYSGITTTCLVLAAGAMLSSRGQPATTADLTLLNSCSFVVERATNHTSCFAVIGNRGPDAAAAVVYNGHLPNLDRSALPPECTAGLRDTFRCELGDLGAGRFSVVSVQARRGPPGEFRISGSISSPIFDPSLEDNTDQTIHARQASPPRSRKNLTLPFDLDVQSAVFPEPVVPGDPMFFQIMVTNRGHERADGATVVNPVTGFASRFRVTAISSSVPGAECLMHHGREPFAVLPVPTAPVDKVNAVCTIGMLPAGASATFTFMVEPETLGSQKFATSGGAFASSPDFLLSNNSAGNLVPQSRCGVVGPSTDVPDRQFENADVGIGVSFVRGVAAIVGFEFEGKRQQDLADAFGELDNFQVAPLDFRLAGNTTQGKMGTKAGTSQVFPNVRANDPELFYGTVGAGECNGLIGVIFDDQGMVAEVRVSHVTADENAGGTIAGLGDFPPGSMIVLFGGEDRAEQSRLLMEGMLNALPSLQARGVMVRYHRGDTLLVDQQGTFYVPPRLMRMPTSTTLTSSPNPSTLGQSVTIVATVTSATTTPTGVVVFRDGGTVIGEASLDASGQATLTLSTLGVGSHPITADYQGDDDFSGSSSPPLSQAVNPADTSTSLMSTPNPSAFGQPVEFAVSVTSAGGIPGGMVELRRGAVVLGTTMLDPGGKAGFTVSTLSVGTHSIAAVYLGDSDFNSSSSPSLTQAVTRAETVSTLMSSPNPSTLGQPVGFIARVMAASGTPTGFVTVLIGGTPVRTVPLAAGAASFTDASLPIGTHEISVRYSGDVSFSPSVSNVVVQAVVAPMLNERFDMP